MYNVSKMKKGAKLISTFAVFMMAVFLPVFALASSSSSERYAVTDQMDFSGGSSSSQNYQVFGILTDMNQIVLWPQVNASGGDSGSSGGGIPVQAGTDIESQEILPVDVPVAGVDDILTINVLGKTSIDKLADEINVPLATTGVVLTLAIALISQLFGGIALLSPLGSLWVGFLSLFGFGKKKEGRWGIVYDAEANEPISLAVVQIFSHEYNKLLTTQTTDKEGRFSLLVDPGTYYIKVFKTNYIFPAKSTAEGYHGATFQVKEKQEINYHIPLDPDHKVLIHRIGVVSRIIVFLNIVRIPVLIIGTILSSIALYMDQSGLNIAIICLYLLIWIVEIYKLRKTRPYGLTKDHMTSEFVDNAILRLFNHENKLVSTQVSDGKGRFSFLTNPGEYYMTAIKSDYDMYKSGELDFDKSGKVNIDVPMDKKKPVIRIVPSVYSDFNDSEKTNQIHGENDSIDPSWA